MMLHDNLGFLNLRELGSNNNKTMKKNKYNNNDLITGNLKFSNNQKDIALLFFVVIINIMRRHEYFLVCDVRHFLPLKLKERFRMSRRLLMQFVRAMV
jgi:hypothetical protein